MADMNCANNVSKNWDLTLPENKAVLDSAAYSSLEHFFLIVIFIIIGVGLLANTIGLFTLIRNRAEWDTYKCYLTCLALADFLYLFSALIFFAVPFSLSPVSFDYPGFSQCYTLLGSILFAQVFETGMILAVAVEAYLRIYHNKPDSHLNTTKSVILLIVITTVVAFILVPCSIPGYVFTSSTSVCVRWPDVPKYDNFPQRITLCPTDTLSTILLFLFHDIPAYWICLVVMTFCYSRVIQRINADGTQLEENQKTETVANLIARIIVFFLCQIVVRVNNFANMVSIFHANEPVLETHAMAYELINFILRLLLVLQPAINPFLYFLARDNFRPLVKKAFGHSD